MKYILNKKETDFKILKFPETIEGLEVSLPIKNEEAVIKIKKIILIDNKLIKSYLSQKINKKFEKLIKLMNKTLQEDEDGDEGAKMALDEIQKMKSMIINKYKIYMAEKQYKDLLTKLILMEEEFKVRYNQKIMFKQMIYNDLEGHKNISR